MTLTPGDIEAIRQIVQEQVERVPGLIWYFPIPTGELRERKSESLADVCGIRLNPSPDQDSESSK
ncbi:hypothetical protein [Mesoterricola sediminis]|uniref:hypothetical protein n=1 Tax=Mesoterricola sediminis TaxID=2927980 RepID=UPI002930355B|nr:hypothetical protein [Mesoterricola sediminis]